MLRSTRPTLPTARANRGAGAERPKRPAHPPSMRQSGKARAAPRRRSGTPLGRRSLEPLLEPVQRVPQLARQLVAELVEELADERDLLAPLGGVDLEHRAQALRADVDALEVQGVLRRHETDRRLLGPRAAVAALEDPLQDARVVAEAGPQVLAR